jgi:hypothetical protein
MVAIVLVAACYMTGALETTSYAGSEWLVKTDVATRKWYASEKLAQEGSEFWTGSDVGGNGLVQKERSQPGYVVSFIYKSGNGSNIFTPDTLEGIRKVDHSLLHHA